MHRPVLLKEVVEYLVPRNGSFIIDGTVDGGGHSAEIFKNILPEGKLLGTDLDASFLIESKKRILSGVENSEKFAGNLILRQLNYIDLPNFLRNEHLRLADGFLLDLGFSSNQLDGGRGFSFDKDEPLLMTYEIGRKPAKELIKELGEKELAKIIFELSGEKFAGRIAEGIKRQEKISPIETTGELRKVVERAVPRNYERGRINPATRTFQALRIYANDELSNLGKILDHLPEIIKPDGRAIIISFQSLEDRMVKNAFRLLEKNGRIKILTKKPVVSSIEEVRENPRSRSAKLRAAVII